MFITKHTTDADCALYELPQNQGDSSLEEKYEEIVCYSFDPTVDCGFIDYLKPNEGPVECIIPHLQGVKKGFIVSVGTERSFMDLIFANDDCKGLIIRDINPRVKAYIDFAVMIMRISRDREDFLSLINPEAYDEATIVSRLFPEEEESQKHFIETCCDVEKDRLIFDEIKRRLEADRDIPDAMKQYYLENCDRFAYYYIRYSHLPPEMKASDEFNYFTHDEPFLKLQRYAKAGNIIATIGDIQDLEFLGETPISVVDTSNVCDYTFIDLRLAETESPRVIWTSFTPITYHSREFDASIRLSPELREEAKEISQVFCKYFQTDNLLTLTKLYLRKIKEENKDIFLSNKIVSLFQQEKMVYIKDFGYLHIGSNRKIQARTAFCIDTADPSRLKALKRSPYFQSLLPTVVKEWRLFKIKPYLFLMDTPGWKEAFEKEVEDKEKFKEHLAAKGQLPIFLERWEMLEQLSSKSV